ncbi:hypothetical protein [Micromonospora sp. NPDC051141]|uniref:hypothetical protein n=1 Tax=Micromonospora sp. NPDC051141 TaxID=3364284 RepID=UPI0037ACB6B2
MLTACGINARYQGGNIDFDLFVDAGTAVGNGVQVRISYDLTGDGDTDWVQTYHYLATDPVPGWEHYRPAQGVRTTSGTPGDLVRGSVRVEVWNAIGAATTSLGTGDLSRIVLPYAG